MSLDPLFAISSQAMALEKFRIDTVANNIANQNATTSVNGQLFRPMRVISHAAVFENLLIDAKAASGGIESVELVEQQVLPRKEYQPGHPAADDKGYVSFPGVNTVDEMTTLVKASRAYEANIKMLNTAKTIALQAISIGDIK